LEHLGLEEVGDGFLQTLYKLFVELVKFEGIEDEGA
jgi:hypothetical protein